MAEPRTTTIALRAWSIYLQRGASHGQAMSDWLEAKQQLFAERGCRPWRTDGWPERGGGPPNAGYETVLSRLQQQDRHLQLVADLVDRGPEQDVLHEAVAVRGHRHQVDALGLGRRG